MYENEEPWNVVVPKTGTLVCFPGDCFQLLTNDYILATPHKVTLKPQERFSFPYFYETNFNAVLRPLISKNGVKIGHEQDDEVLLECGGLKY